MAMEEGTCPICEHPVTRGSWVGHVNMGLQPHRHLYQAFCESCQIVLERIVVGGEDTGWFSNSVDLQDIVGELSDADVQGVEKMLAKSPTLLAQWQAFIVQKRHTDLVCRFKRDDSPYTGLTIKRGDHLIGQFSLFQNL
jgi:hypothetical protein